MHRFAQLPGEILLNVFKYMDALDLESLRSTSHELVQLIEEDVWHVLFRRISKRCSSLVKPPTQSDWRREMVLRAQVARALGCEDESHRRCQPKLSYEDHGDFSSYRVNRSIYKDNFLFRARRFLCDITVLDCADGHVTQISLLGQAGDPSGSLEFIRPLDNGYLYKTSYGPVRKAQFSIREKACTWQIRTWPYTANACSLTTLAAAAVHGDSLATLWEDGTVNVWDGQEMQPVWTVNMKDQYESVSSIMQYDVGLVTDGKQIVIYGTRIHWDDSANTALVFLVDIESRSARPVTWNSFSFGPVFGSANMTCDWDMRCLYGSTPTGISPLFIEGMSARWLTPDTRAYMLAAFSPRGPLRLIVIIKDSTEQSNFISVFDMGNLESPLWSCPVTSLVSTSAGAISHTLVVVGLHDGQVLAFDALSGLEYSPLMKSHDRPRWEDGRERRLCSIMLHPFLAQGILDYEGQVLAFDLQGKSTTAVQTAARDGTQTV